MSHPCATPACRRASAAPRGKSVRETPRPHKAFTKKEKKKMQERYESKSFYEHTSKQTVLLQENGDTMERWRSPTSRTTSVRFAVTLGLATAFCAVLESNPRLLNSSNAAGSRTSLSLSDGMFAFHESFKAICKYIQLTTPKLTKSGPPNKPKTPEFSFSRIHAPTTHD